MTKKKAQPAKKPCCKWIWAVAAAIIVLAAVLLFAPKRAQVAKITFRDYGTVTVALDVKNAPKTVAQFVKLAQDGFYDGTKIIRAVPNLLIQGGAPRDGEAEAPNVKGEFAANGVKNERSHVRGTISLARAMPYDSGSSQFFIVCGDYPSWDGQYAAFGEVTDGMEIVDAIADREIATADGAGFLPEEYQVEIERVVIENAE